jgi:hypothetical protein
VVTDHEALLSRRTLLGAGIGGLVLASSCTTRHATPQPDPDARAIDAARRGERMLLESYAEGTDGHTTHLAHLRALGDDLPPPTPDPVPRGVRPPPETVTVQPLLDAARTAIQGGTAALLASIAASHAVLSGVRVP